MKLNFKKVYVFITGTCMYLNGGNSVLNDYNCSKFRHGCPNSSYFSDEVYKCNLLKMYDLAMVLFWNILPLIANRFFSNTCGLQIIYTHVHVQFCKYHIVNE